MKKIIIGSFILLLSIAFLKVLLTKSVIVKTIRDLITSENKLRSCCLPWSYTVQEQLVIVDKLLTTTIYFSEYMSYLVLRVGYMHYFYRISMGFWVPASSEIDNRETLPLTNFWILLLKLLEFCHKALTNASLSLYPITAQALVSVPDYSLVTFSGCGAFLWTTVPTLCHQLVPERWRLLAALPVNWTVAFIHPLKEF